MMVESPGAERFMGRTEIVGPFFLTKQSDGKL
jgi:hypothetical protein